MKGTPTTLKDAILNGLTEGQPGREPAEVTASLVEGAVRDFLAQQFNVFTLNDDKEVLKALYALWQLIHRERESDVLLGRKEGA